MNQKCVEILDLNELVLTLILISINCLQCPGRSAVR